MVIVLMKKRQGKKKKKKNTHCHELWQLCGCCGGGNGGVLEKFVLLEERNMEE